MMRSSMPSTSRLVPRWLRLSRRSSTRRAGSRCAARDSRGRGACGRGAPAGAELRPRRAGSGWPAGRAGAHRPRPKTRSSRRSYAAGGPPVARAACDGSARAACGGSRRAARSCRGRVARARRPSSAAHGLVDELELASAGQPWYSLRQRARGGSHTAKVSAKSSVGWLCAYQWPRCSTNFWLAGRGDSASDSVRDALPNTFATPCAGAARTPCRSRGRSRGAGCASATCRCRPRPRA